uniref:Uncharacterized protein n=1 Tax=Triticum urartu TaxID=4572 RepID=A0A8R7TNP8_TRIUA
INTNRHQFRQSTKNEQASAHFLHYRKFSSSTDTEITIQYLLSSNLGTRRGGDGWSSEGFVDGGDGRGRRGGAQGPGRALPLELCPQVHPSDSQGKGQRPRRRRRLARQEAASDLCGGSDGEAASRQGRGGAEDGHVPQLLGPKLGVL